MLIESIPAHVPAERVSAFDPYTDERMREDLHGALVAMQDKRPDIFYTPANGGHWVVTRFELMDKVLKDSSSFSSVQAQVPLISEPWILIPLNLDPPAHTPYRTLLMRHFSLSAIRGWDPFIRAEAARLIEETIAQKHCDFAEGVALKFPVSVFMSFMGWPIEKLDYFRGLAVRFFNSLTDPTQSGASFAAIEHEVRSLITARQAEPGKDLIGQLMTEKIEGRRLSVDELVSIGCILFLAGLDSVATAASYIFHYLAKHPELQDELTVYPDRIEPFIEEAMRKFGIVNIVRVAKRDVVVGDMSVRSGEPVMCLLPLAGLDSRRNPDPARFQIERRNRQHLIFGGGVHACIGNVLARRELRILLEEWLKRIPRFGLQPGFKPEYRIGQQTSLMHLMLEW